MSFFVDMFKRKCLLNSSQVISSIDLIISLSENYTITRRAMFISNETLVSLRRTDGTSEFNKIMEKTRKSRFSDNEDKNEDFTSIIFLIYNDSHWSIGIYYKKERKDYSQNTYQSKHYDSIRGHNYSTYTEICDLFFRNGIFHKDTKLQNALYFYQQESSWECGYYTILASFIHMVLTDDDDEPEVYFRCKNSMKYIEDLLRIIDKICKQ